MYKEVLCFGLLDYVCRTTLTNLSRRILISLNRTHLYITVGTYKEDYLSFIRGRYCDWKSQDSFLVMTQYGPWNLKIPEEVREVGPILLALSAVESPEDYEHLKVPWEK